ncbi:uncharacterized protein [Rutidosis leptorrhynchoides]|uniref:uncharacterized protein n=1 Tax=Rutidosis leptorrhynchoides TaxID=125765 RepID=UPI003A993242
MGKWKGRDVDSFIVNVYGPHDDANKLTVWASLENFVGEHDVAWILGGDFNEVRDPLERKNCIFKERRASWFNDFINNSRLLDVPLMESERKPLDHCPIILRDKEIDFGPKPIKIFDEWLDEAGAEDVIKKAWNLNIFGKIEEEISDLKCQATNWELLAENRDLSERKRESWLDSSKKWIEKEKIKSNMAKQKSRVKWSLEENGKPSQVAERINQRQADDLERRFSELEGLIKDDLLNALNWFWDKCEISNGCNASFITLVPKNSDPLSLNEFRPISLIGCYYKILAKFLSIQIIRVIPNLIGVEQNAFIKGRYILDGALIANEVIDYLIQKKSKSLIFKVDFEKAFDSLNWNFLLEMMSRMGFGERWRRLIHACIKSSSISMLVNGSPTNEFHIERGVRQGDPLSPFLFIIAAEGWNILTKNATRCSLLKGVEIGSDKVPVSHLQYANDTIFLGEWNRHNINNLIKLLSCFEKASGLRINFHKSVIYGLGVSPNEIEYMASHVGCKVGEFPFTYLGIPIGRNMNRVENWSSVVETFNSKLGTRKSKTVSFGGSIHGDFGLLPPSGLNWQWGKSGVWTNILRACYDIEKLGVNFSRSFFKSIGNGLETSFWCDPWLGDKPLQEAFNWLFRLDNNQEATVNNKIKWEASTWSASWDWSRDINGRNSGELQDLCNLLNSFVKQDTRIDTWNQNLASNEIFTTKKLTRIIDDIYLQDGRNRVETWRNNLVPLKVEIFIWRVLNRRISVRTELDKRGIHLDSVRCPLCDDDIESIDHSMFFCRSSWDVWERVYKWWNIGAVANLGINDTFRGKCNRPLSPLGSCIWQAVEWTCAYLIWSNRNKKVFSNKSWIGAMALMEIQLKTIEWIAPRFKKENIQWLDWLSNPLK